MHEEVFDDRTERERGQEVERADEQHGANEQDDESPAVHGE